MPYHTYTLRRRRIRWIHPDRIFHRNFPFEVYPWNELSTKHEFISDVRDDETGKLIGIVARPDIYSSQYGNDLYYGCLLERNQGNGDIFVSAEWTSDFEQETTLNKDKDGNLKTGPNRLICLSFNIYNPNEMERIERKLQQQRLALQQTPWFLAFNLIKRSLRKPEEDKGEIAQLGSYYNLDFKLDGKDIVLDENVLPGRIRSFGSRFYELKTTNGETVARFYRKAGFLGLSAFHIVDEYRIEIDKKYENNKPLLYLCIAIGDYLHMEDRIRRNCFYEGKKPENIPSLSRIFRYD